MANYAALNISNLESTVAADAADPTLNVVQIDGLVLLFSMHELSLFLTFLFHLGDTEDH
jgi:hypothetical protein